MYEALVTINSSDVAQRDIARTRLNYMLLNCQQQLEHISFFLLGSLQFGSHSLDIIKAYVDINPSVMSLHV